MTFENVYLTILQYVYIGRPCLALMEHFLTINHLENGGVDLGNIKSAKKRIVVAQVRTERNKAIKSGVKTAIKKVNAAVEAGDKAAASAALVAATSEINSAASKGVYHKNNASRKVSRLAAAVNKMA